MLVRNSKLYAAVAMATDYDSWKKDEASVTWEQICSVFDKNVHNIIGLLKETVSMIEE